MIETAPKRILIIIMRLRTARYLASIAMLPIIHLRIWGRLPFDPVLMIKLLALTALFLYVAVSGIIRNQCAFSLCILNTTHSKVIENRTEPFRAKQ